MSKEKKYQVAAYYYPAYHQDRSNDKWHGKGWTEWDLIIHSHPRFEGHDQPKVPLWGYQDESKPEVMQQKVDAAADHGIDVFIFDWYWYESGPFQGRALDEGFLKSSNLDRIQFAIMWANHDWDNRQPAVFKGPRASYEKWDIPSSAWEQATDHIIRNYFSHEAYWKIDGMPYFSFYSIAELLTKFGGIEGTRRALEGFDIKARSAGFKGIHFNMIYIPDSCQGLGVENEELLAGLKAEALDPDKLARALGFKSVTSYVNVQYYIPGTFPRASYTGLTEHMRGVWEKIESKLSIPYYPNVTMGWDCSPRTCQSDKYEDIGYPFMYVLADNTPANYKRALEHAQQFLDQRPDGERIVTLNAWNEWTEGCYLEPDTKHGMAYLEAVRDVFGVRKA